MDSEESLAASDRGIIKSDLCRIGEDVLPVTS